MAPLPPYPISSLSFPLYFRPFSGPGVSQAALKPLSSWGWPRTSDSSTFIFRILGLLLVCVVLGNQALALYVLGQPSANWATSQPALFSEFSTVSGIFTEINRRDRIHNFRVLESAFLGLPLSIHFLYFINIVEGVWVYVYLIWQLYTCT